MTTRNPNARLCQNNIAAATGVTITASSAKSGFPASNLTNAFRWKRWIPSGSFRVTSSNNTIYIADGSNKTVTLTAAVYATGTALATHIQTQLNASSTNWTCTYSTTTYKFTIGRSSGTATLRFTQTTNAAWDMLGYVGVSDTSAGTGLAADQVRIHTTERLDIDLLTSRSCTALFVVGQASEDFPISSAATITLKADDIQANLDSSPTLSVTLSREATGIFKFLDDLASTTFRYWRFEWNDRTNPTGPEVSICQFYLGDYVTPVNRNFDMGFSKQLVDNSRVFVSDAGVPYFSRRTKYWRYDGISLQWLSDSDRTEIERVMTEMGVTTPFFISFDPLVGFSSSLGELTKYVRFESLNPLQQNRYKYFTVPLTLVEVVG